MTHFFKITIGLFIASMLSGCANMNTHKVSHYVLCASAGAIAGGLIGGAVDDEDSDGVAVGAAGGAAIATLLCPAEHEHKEMVCAEPAPTGATLDANGCAFDSDNDGVVDGIDQCPGTLAGVNVNAMGCPADDDKDGVDNSRDNCPNTPMGTAVDNEGCALPMPKKVISLKGVTFKTNSDILTTSAKVQLDEAIVTLKEEATNIDTLRVEGHTDNTGNADYNQQLSQRRAEAVVNYLIQAGAFSQAQLLAIGMGQTKPIASNASAEGRAQNRRVDLLINQ